MANVIQINFRAGGVNEVERALRGVEQSTERAAERTKRAYADETRLVQRVSKDKEREFAKLEREVDQWKKREVKAAEKADKDEVRSAKKAADDKIKAEKQWARQRQQIQENSARLAYRIAEEEVRAEERAEKKKQRIRERYARTAGRSVGGLVRGAVGLAGGALALGGGFGIADAVQKQFALEHEAALFSNMSSTMPGGRVATKDIMAQSRAIGIANGMDPSQIAASMGAYFAKSSDVQGAMQNASLFAQLSKATGSDVTQIASVAGALRVQNPDLDQKGMENMLLGIVGQTRLGAVDIADLVQHVPVITSTSSLYGGEQAQNQRKLIGLSQVAMRTSGSSAEAAEAVARFGADVASNSGKIAGATGFSVKDKSGALKDPAEIIAALMKASKGDIGALKHMGIGRESMKLFEAEAKTFKAAGGGEAGAAAVRKDVSQFTEGGYTQASLASDLANTMNTSGERFAKAHEKLASIIEERAAPMMERLASTIEEHEPEIERFFNTMADGLEWLVSHPWEGVGLAVTAAIGKSIAQAAIGDVVKKLLTRAFAEHAGGGGGGGGGGGVVTTAVLAGAGYAGYKVISSGLTNLREGEDYSANVIANVRAGKITPAQAQAMLTAAQHTTGAAGTAKHALFSEGKFFTDIVGGNKTIDAEDKQFNQAQQLVIHTKELQAAITDAIKKGFQDAPQGGAAPNAPHRNQPLSHPARGGTQ